jgi:hypothetical protein
MINHDALKSGCDGRNADAIAGFSVFMVNELREGDAMMRCVGSAIEFW